MWCLSVSIHSSAELVSNSNEGLVHLFLAVLYISSFFPQTLPGWIILYKGNENSSKYIQHVIITILHYGEFRSKQNQATLLLKLRCILPGLRSRNASASPLSGYGPGEQRILNSAQEEQADSVMGAGDT